MFAYLVSFVDPVQIDETTLERLDFARFSQYFLPGKDEPYTFAWIRRYLSANPLELARRGRILQWLNAQPQALAFLELLQADTSLLAQYLYIQAANRTVILQNRARAACLLATGCAWYATGNRAIRCGSDQQRCL